MNVLSYLIAIVVLGASVWFSYDVKNKFTELREQKDVLSEENDNRARSIEKTKTEAVGAETARDEALAELEATKAELRQQKDNLALKAREEGEWKDKIATQEEEVKNVQDLITAVKNAAGDLNVDIEEVPALLVEMEAGVKDKSIQLEGIQELLSTADARVETVATDLEGLKKRFNDRKARLKSNSSKGFIEAVNHNWGIAVVKVPSGMIVDSSSRLLVRRGASYIGSLKISSVEGSKIITDIDYKSLNQGMVLQEGDTVFLAKPLTN